MDLPLAWHTDLAVLRLNGATVDERPDHLVVRSPANPLHHWGNLVLVTDAERVDEPEHWLEVFERELPEARHRSIGLVADPRDPEAWQALDLELDRDDVLATTTPPAQTRVPQGYLFKQLADAIEWEQSTGLRIQEFAADDPHEAEFERRSTGTRREASATGEAAWFGAFFGDRLVAELGIVLCGDGVARYQSVVTAADHRRRGLAGHLLGVAADWAAEHGAHRWVIVADDGSDAARLYRARGFQPAGRGVRAGRKPPA
ncbi:GNAT family N-acetyltransferase [Nocardioides pocheonensis]|nr:GNAT family N-acetyltransferase [Nocardioides pocheonensis]